MKPWNRNCPGRRRPPRPRSPSLNAKLDLLLAQAESETAALELDPDGAPGRDEPDALLAWLDAAAAAAAEGRRSAAAGAEKQADDQASLLEAANARANRHAKLAAAEQRRIDADAAAPVLAGKAVTLGLHRQAEMLGGQLRAVESAAAAEDLAGTALLEAARQLRSAAATDPELAGQDVLDAGVPTADDDDAAPVRAGKSVMLDSAAVRGTLARLRSLHAVLTERLPDEARLARADGAAAAGCACNCRSWKTDGWPAPPHWTPCALSRRPCPPASAPSRNWPRKSSCAPRRPRQRTNS